jgi:hypothetical protein
MPSSDGRARGRVPRSGSNCGTGCRTLSFITRTHLAVLLLLALLLLLGLRLLLLRLRLWLGWRLRLR